MPSHYNTADYSEYQKKKHAKAHAEYVKKQNKKKAKKQMPSHVGLAAKLKARKKKIEAATKKK